MVREPDGFIQAHLSKQTTPDGVEWMSIVVGQKVMATVRLEGLPEEGHEKLAHALKGLLGFMLGLAGMGTQEVKKPPEAPGPGLILPGGS